MHPPVMMMVLPGAIVEDDAHNGTKRHIFAEVTFLKKPKGKNDGGSKTLAIL